LSLPVGSCAAILSLIRLQFGHIHRFVLAPDWKRTKRIRNDVNLILSVIKVMGSLMTLSRLETVFLQS